MTRRDKYDALERFTPMFEPPTHSFEGFLRHRERKRRHRRIATGVTGTAIVVALVATLATVLPNNGASTATEPDMTIGESPSVATTPDTSAPTSAAAGVEILAPDQSWGGLSRGEWAAQWWQRLLAMPQDISPYYDTTGERCGYQQSGPVFLLPGSFTGTPVERTCVVPEGTAIFAWVAGEVCSTVDEPPFFGRTEEELRTCASGLFDEVTTVQATVNGHDVTDLDSYRTTTPMFAMTLSEDNIFGYQPGVADAVAESINFIIAPPPPGEYEITVSRNSAITTTLIVEAPQVIEPPTT